MNIKYSFCQFLKISVIVLSTNESERVAPELEKQQRASPAKCCNSNLHYSKCYTSLIIIIFCYLPLTCCVTLKEHLISHLGDSIKIKYFRMTINTRWSCSSEALFITLNCQPHKSAADKDPRTVLKYTGTANAVYGDLVKIFHLHSSALDLKACAGLIIVLIAGKIVLSGAPGKQDHAFKCDWHCWHSFFFFCQLKCVSSLSKVTFDTRSSTLKSSAPSPHLSSHAAAGFDLLTWCWPVGDKKKVLTILIGSS